MRARSDSNDGWLHVATSLAIAPGAAAESARVVDLDGPLLLAQDRPEAAL